MENKRIPRPWLNRGFPIGGESGTLVKDYRGKNAEQEIRKFDGGLEARIAEDLKQAAIEEASGTRSATRRWPRSCRSR